MIPNDDAKNKNEYECINPFMQKECRIPNFRFNFHLNHINNLVRHFSIFETERKYFENL